MTRNAPSDRLTEGWEQGFTAGPARLLSVVGGGYRGLLGTRDWLYARGLLRSRTLGLPVVSVGNITVGGTGKTPAVELVVQTLLELGQRPAIVSRGYGRRSGGIQIVADTASIRLDAEDAGDEPFLLARRLPGVPVVVGSNRYDAARRALERFGVTAIVLDDGFQHRTLKKSLEIVMVRAHHPWGNGRLLPAGPLREPLTALRKADLVVATGVAGPDDLVPLTTMIRRHAPEVPVLGGAYVPTECWETSSPRPLEPSHLARLRLLAFAGIGSPASFERTLRDLGVDLAEMRVFPDHHWYSRADLVGVGARATALAAQGMVTTEKDWVRLRRLPASGLPLYVLSVRLALVAGQGEWRAALERACPAG